MPAARMIFAADAFQVSEPGICEAMYSHYAFVPGGNPGGSPPGTPTSGCPTSGRNAMGDPSKRVLDLTATDLSVQKVDGSFAAQQTCF